MYGFRRDAQLQATVNKSCWHKASILFTTVHNVMEITNGQPLQNSIQYSVFPRRAECHCQVAEVLLHKYKRMIKSKFTTSNALLNSAEYAIKRKEHFSFLA
jgi:hypothetical protein